MAAVRDGRDPSVSDFFSLEVSNNCVEKKRTADSFSSGSQKTT